MEFLVILVIIIIVGIVGGIFEGTKKSKKNAFLDSKLTTALGPIAQADYEKYLKPLERGWRSIGEFDAEAQKIQMQIITDINEPPGNNRTSRLYVKIAEAKDQVCLKLKAREHYVALSRNMRKRIKKNDYGALLSDDRPSEAREFLDSIGFSSVYITRDQATLYVIEAIEDFDRQLAGGEYDPSNLPKDGHEFELWVSDQLNKCGWDSHVTSGSGDQGVDVIAKRGALTVGLQCKLASEGKIGNKAVQEIIAAQRFFGFEKAVVVSNAEYTPSAKELADKCGVKLISHLEIPILHDLLSVR